MSRTAPARVGDETTLFAELHPKLARQVRRLVRTGEENVQDACSFAFLQLLRYQPSRESVFSWLLTVAVGEAVKLDQTRPARAAVPCSRGRRRARARRRARQPRAADRGDRGRRPDRPAGSYRGTTCGRAHVRVDQRDAGAERTDRGALRARRKLRFALADQGG